MRIDERDSDGMIERLQEVQRQVDLEREAVNRLTKTQIQELIDLTIAVDFVFWPIQERFSKMIRGLVEELGITPVSTAIVFLNSIEILEYLDKLVLEPIQIIDPMANWSFRSPEDEKEEKRWTKSLST